MLSLHADWTSSLLMLLDATMLGDCPYFYIVTQQLSILGREIDLASLDRAFIRPTTVGFGFRIWILVGKVIKEPRPIAMSKFAIISKNR